jgi:signal transduction histidine kinase
VTNTPIELPAHLDLDAFISEQAHDLRSPFNQVVGFSKVLLNDLGADPAPVARKEDLEPIYRNGQRALLLMNGLIDLARLNRHERESNPAEIEITVLLEQSLAYWRKFNPASLLQTKYQISTPASHLYADELLLRQILSGFIMVVAQYADRRAEVTLTVEEEPGWFIFKVSSAGKKARPFSQLDVKMQGHLGRAMIELQHGEIRQAAEADNGASIEFALPKP